MEASSQPASSSSLPHLHVLLVDPWAATRPALARVLRESYRVTLEQSAEGAVQCVRQHKPAMIILDAGENNLEILRQIEEYDQQIPLLLVGHHPPEEYEGEGFKRSALKMWLDHTIASRSLHTQIANLQAAERIERTFGRFVTSSPEMIATFRVLERVVNTDVPILITGESGSGKELIARGVHDTSTRRDQPFVAINCAAIPENLLETELFGYEKGAFTGATATRQGKLEHVGRGTLFLDELGEMPLSTQAKLLRVLQEQTFERVGGHQSLLFRARIVAATNKNLAEAIGQRTFREDLLYRLNTIHVALPPLRERREDIALLIQHFLTAFNQRYQRQILGLSPTTLNTLQKYDWPGNVRELLNCIHHAVLLCDDARIELRDLPATFQPGLKATVLLDQVGKVPLETIIDQARRDLERQILTFALEKFGYNKARSAYFLGIDRTTLYRKMKELEIPGERAEVPNAALETRLDAPASEV